METSGTLYAINVCSFSSPGRVNFISERLGSISLLKLDLPVSISLRCTWGFCARSQEEEEDRSLLCNGGAFLKRNTKSKQIPTPLDIVIGILSGVLFPTDTLFFLILFVVTLADFRCLMDVPF